MYSVGKIQSSLNIAFWPILCKAQIYEFELKRQEYTTLT